ncbi:uncharacterized protein MYCFIDRAFT_83400 [Pseudocercospora fijiensis CIRAD86]|uniref:Uncharacterized protein n=1 Tax=Pseudocercospora fijiensis (strain CIRAD86) TaxID=383855 RepID=M3B7M3_PSEFD|nr:uncharacterized protein MYCFIDRAFT_83400 [Pseudocercospora fijiensis CIRAD86]EME85318.1 hypothetical protein MYCFIDRAFT_83400 [Pseudocercospora fijiensis CIRAD86]
MRHLDGVRVALKSNGQDLTEYSNQYCKKTFYLDRSIGSRSVILPAGSQFEVLLELDRSFKLQNASGVSVVIAFHPDYYAQQGTEYAQVFWIPLKPATLGSKYTFGHTMVWHDGVQAAQLFPLKMPAPAKRPQNASDEWLKDPVYQANHGCVSVHVQRGKVDLQRAARERIEDFKSSKTNVEPRRNALQSNFEQSYPIRLSWFFSKGGKHGEPYVFEFRNLRPHEVDYTTAGELNFKEAELYDFDATEKNSLADEDTGFEQSDSGEEEAIIDHRRTLSTEDGSPVKYTRKLRARANARQRINYREIYPSSDEESSDEDDEDDEEDDISLCGSENEVSGTAILSDAAASKSKQGSKTDIQGSKRLTAPKARSKGKQSLRGLGRDDLRLKTLSRLPMPPSAAIKRKLYDCNDEDEDDEEFLPQVIKTEKFAVTAPSPQTSNQESPNSSHELSSSSSGHHRGSSSSKRARIERDLEMLKIRKRELELLNQLDELEQGE